MYIYIYIYIWNPKKQYYQFFANNSAPYFPRVLAPKHYKQRHQLSRCPIALRLVLSKQDASLTAAAPVIADISLLISFVGIVVVLTSTYAP